MKSISFCPSCASKGFVNSESKSWQCSSCGFIYFHNTASAVGGILKVKNEILLAIRKHNPGKGMLDLPGGFVDYDESLEAALVREMQEELRVTLGPWRYVFSYPNRYEYEGVLYNTIDAFFLTELDEKPNVIASDDVADIVWVDIQEIDLESIEFVSVRNAVIHLQGNEDAH